MKIAMEDLGLQSLVVIVPGRGKAIKLANDIKIMSLEEYCELGIGS